MSLVDAGMNHSEASRQMGVGLRTVQRWLACGVFPERKHRVFPSIVDAYGPHLESGWDRIRSPLMLPIVRRRAQAGDGQALLRWADVDAAGATAFMRMEVMRPMPRFSSFYIRLPEASLPEQEKQIASNFIALTQPPDLVRSATLLHRYATRAVLPIVMPFINSKLDGWYCLIQFPVVAYLLKVAPEDAAPRVEQVLRGLGRGYCPTREFLTDIGFLQPSPVLERIAAQQIEADTPFARDGIEYLRLYGGHYTKRQKSYANGKFHVLSRPRLIPELPGRGSMSASACYRHPSLSLRPRIIHSKQS